MSLPIIIILFCFLIVFLRKKNEKKFREEQQRMFEEERQRQRRQRNSEEQQRRQQAYNDDVDTLEVDFQHALVTLFASVMRADGKCLKSELYVIKSHLLQNFGEKRANELLQTLRQLVNGKYDTSEMAKAAAQLIRRYADLETIISIYQTCFEIAFADQEYNDSEQKLLYIIGVTFGMGVLEIRAIEQQMLYAYQDVFRRHQQQQYQQYQQYQQQQYQQQQYQQQQRNTTLSRAYKLLGIDQTATDEEVKKTYRTLAAKNHPDRFANESAEVQQQATKRFQEINEAYDYIKSARGIN